MSKQIVSLVKREFWEHRSLWLVPVAAACVFILGAIFGGVNMSGNGVDFHIGPGGLPNGPDMVPREVTGSIGALSLLAIAGFLGIFSGIAVFSYLLDCLFAERKDRSILFWKSLPVSDLHTVLAKLLVAMLLVPLLVLALATLLQPLSAVIAYLRFPELRPFFGGHVSGLSALPYLMVVGLFGLLWYLPVATYLMLASVLAKRAPLVYAVIPPLALGIAEQVFLDSDYVARFLVERVFPWASRVQHLFTDSGAPGLKTLGGDWWVLFQDMKLWLGLVAAAGMMYLVVRLRRYRDDT